MKCSICMATYNGEIYLGDQINSILNEMNREDELIIIDDCSTDDTVKLIKSIKDDRIKISVHNENRGHVYTFAHAIELAKNDIIFLSDQDDIWIEGRKKLMLNTLIKSKTLLVSSNFYLTNKLGLDRFEEPNYLKQKDSNNYIRNIVGIFLGKKNYYGCAMAFKKELKKIILPIPRFVESHDLWIAIVANVLKKNLHIENKTLLRRIHSSNLTSSNRPFSARLKTRTIHIKSIIIILKRVLFTKFKSQEIYKKNGGCQY